MRWILTYPKFPKIERKEFHDKEVLKEFVSMLIDEALWFNVDVRVDEEEGEKCQNG